MIESAAYDLIKQEGLQQGFLQDARESIFDNLEVRFGVVPTGVAKIVNTIEQLAVLKALRRKSAIVQSLDEFKTAIAQAIEG